MAKQSQKVKVWRLNLIPEDSLILQLWAVSSGMKKSPVCWTFLKTNMELSDVCAMPDPAGLQCRAGAKLPEMPVCVPSVPFVVMCQCCPSEVSEFLSSRFFRIFPPTQPLDKNSIVFIILGALTEILIKFIPNPTCLSLPFPLKYTPRKFKGVGVSFCASKSRIKR